MGKIQAVTKWEEDLLFVTEVGSHRVSMDGSPEPRAAATPKQALLGSMASCAGIDVVSILKKMRLNITQCEVHSETETTDSYPSVFKSVLMAFHLRGEIKPEQAQRAVELSMTKYCGVTAMIADAIPVFYKIDLNGDLIFEGQADFGGED